LVRSENNRFVMIMEITINNPPNVGVFCFVLKCVFGPDFLIGWNKEWFLLKLIYFNIEREQKIAGKIKNKKYCKIWLFSIR